MKIFIMIMSLILTISCSDFNPKEIKCDSSKDCPTGYTICNKDSENSKGYCSTKCDLTGNDCGEFETTKQCNVKTNECVECLTDESCSSGNKCVENQCKEVCRENKDCGNYICKKENNNEVGYCLTSCTENSDCISEYYCNTGDDKNKCESCNFCENENYSVCIFSNAKSKKACCEKGSDSFNDHQCYLLCVDSYYSEGKGFCVDDCKNNEERDDNILACFCKNGFGGQNCEDINECEAETDNCSDNANCKDTDGSFFCECKEGFSGDGIQCDDINECEEGTDSCDDNSDCINGDGSYYCVCKTGFDSNGIECVDVDECDLNIDDCESGFECINIIGAFECNNINECVLNTDNCDENATCLDMEGSFLCTCMEGFLGDGENCYDINECEEETDYCDDNSDCINGNGSYYCVCKTGFENNGTGCIDINECLNPSICPRCINEACDNPQSCQNTEGSFICISLCEVCENGTCTIIEGFPTCICHQGLQDNNRDSICTESCETYECDPIQNQVCVDTNGTAQCVCKTGFYPNPLNNSPACILEENCELECPSEYSCMLNNGYFYCCKEVGDVLECPVK